MVTRYFVAYDVADPERLRKVHGVVKAYGERVQYSVYEVLVSERERVLLEEHLRQVLNLKEDMVMFIDLGAASRRDVPGISTLGRPYRPRERGSIVL